jgi:hypothetical protein
MEVPVFPMLFAKLNEISLSNRCSFLAHEVRFADGKYIIAITASYLRYDFHMSFRQPRQQLINIRKILIEGWTTQSRCRHQPVDRQFRQRYATKQPFGGVQNLGFGSVWGASPPLTRLRQRSLPVQQKAFG